MPKETNAKKIKRSGYKELIQRTFAVIVSSLAALTQGKSTITPTSNLTPNVKESDYHNSQKKVLKPKLVLKLSKNPLNNGVAVMHLSHSSHSSHSSHMSSSSSGHYSHSSHSSHSWHYSSSPVYVTPVPHVNSQHSNSGSSNFKTNQNTSSKFSSTYKDTSLTTYALSSRKLYEGCEGTDVKELQQLLIDIGLLSLADGYFGESTKLAVMKFQQSNLLTVDGVVGKVTLAAIQAKTYAH